MKLKKDGTPSRQGEGGGQPPKYATEKELQAKINYYFDFADRKERIYSKAGLFNYLDISRDTWGGYKKKYPDTIRKTNDTIEEAWVTRLSSTGATGAIFYLKNAFKNDYQEHSDVDITSGGKPIYGGRSTLNQKQNGISQRTETV